MKRLLDIIDVAGAYTMLAGIPLVAVGAAWAIGVPVLAAASRGNLLAIGLSFMFAGVILAIAHAALASALKKRRP